MTRRYVSSVLQSFRSRASVDVVQLEHSRLTIALAAKLMAHILSNPKWSLLWPEARYLSYVGALLFIPDTCDTATNCRRGLFANIKHHGTPRYSARLAVLRVSTQATEV